MKLNEICIIRTGTINAGRNHSTSRYGNLLYITSKDILFNVITDSQERFSENFIRQHEVEIVPKGSILVSATGLNAGNIALLAKEAVVNQNVFYITIKNRGLKPEFLYYYLCFKRHVFIKVSKYGIRVSCKYLKELTVPFPPVKQQECIIEHLDMHLTKLTISINNNIEALNEIQDQKQFLINKNFPSGAEKKGLAKWAILKYQDCGIIKAGRTPNSAIKDYYGIDFPLFKPSDLQSEMYIKEPRTFLSSKGLREARHVKANSLLICINGIHLGKAGITQVDGGCSQQMISFAPDSKLLSKFVYFQINSDYFKKQILNESAKPIVKKSVFNNLSLAVTNLKGQQKIIDNIIREIGLLEKKESDINEELRLLNEAKYNLFLHAFTCVIE